MANPEHLEIIMQGVEVWNEWRQHLGIRPDLSGADLGSIPLRRANFSNTDFRQANLGFADLSLSDLSFADLRNADCHQALFGRADLSGANLNGTNFTSARLKIVNFNCAYLQNANLTEASFALTIFTDNDLSSTRGLETVKHDRPSSIGIDTLVKSKGQIPESFLRGCGLSDWEIESAKLYNPDLSNEEINNLQNKLHDLRVSQAFQIKPLFISYSHLDGAFVDAIENRLAQQGIRYWRDVHHAIAGRLERQIDQAIHLNDIVLLVLSELSINSDWVEHEVRKAREKEKQTGKDALCPVALDDSWKTCRWPGWLREQVEKYNILDFSNWQDATQFQKMFGKLLEGLNLFYK